MSAEGLNQVPLFSHQALYPLSHLSILVCVCGGRGHFLNSKQKCSIIPRKGEVEKAQELWSKNLSFSEPVRLPEPQGDSGTVTEAHASLGLLGRAV